MICAKYHDLLFALNSGNNDKTVSLRDTVHQISRGESAAAGLPEGDLVDSIT